ncbi:cytochrome c biogenesis CcdA family protein [Cytobacillus sp. FSL W7-1323]|uniref:cytochrome c biogenesis CcdA family protein n=2 Tax=Bacillaceae TaxID=186817 RepID=UPI002AFE989F|nr:MULTISPECIES: cytochrome c biogenesis CcdA family protein [Cytobacillus]MEA1854849.1 cytochrome c biogenesis CcdA family protein [Cytobacillus sp. OWB-43]MED1608098.1 cytochrome c biogenesis CcdA family protein [Cytobacillus kochii]
MDIMNMTVTLALLGGLLAFFSPCTLPLYPTFISYITGVSVNDLKQKHGAQSKVILHAVAFCFGLASLNYVLGFSASFLGEFFREYNDLIRMFGGIFLIMMGIFLMGLFQPKLLMKEIRLFKYKQAGTFLSSYLVGVIFAAAWTPCIGPILGAIIYASLAQPPEQTFIHITAYSLGFSIPFILLGFAIEKVRFFHKYSSHLMKMGGFILIIIGVMVYFDQVYVINIWGAKAEFFLKGLWGMITS